MNTKFLSLDSKINTSEHQIDLPKQATVNGGWQARAIRIARAFAPAQSVILQGFYGGGNLGDEAILASSLNTIRGVGGNPVVFAHDPAAVATDWGVRSLDHKTAASLSHAHALATAQAFLLGGGGLLKDYGGGSGNVSRWLRWIVRAKACGIPTMTWSLGVENLIHEKSRRMVQEGLNGISVITVRDERSAELLEEVGVREPIHVTADPVPALVRPYRIEDPQSNSSPTVVVSLRHWYALKFETVDETVFSSFLSELATGLSRLVRERGARVLLIPFRTVPYDDDREVLSDLAQRMTEPSELVDGPSAGLDTTIRLMASADLVVGMRLHAAVIGMTLGIPTIAVEYMPKVRDYMAEVDSLDWVAPVHLLTEGWLMERARVAFDSSRAERSRLHKATDALADRFEQNGKLLARLLS